MLAADLVVGTNRLPTSGPVSLETAGAPEVPGVAVDVAGPGWMEGPAGLSLKPDGTACMRSAEGRSGPCPRAAGTMGLPSFAPMATTLLPTGRNGGDDGMSTGAPSDAARGEIETPVAPLSEPTKRSVRSAIDWDIADEIIPGLPT